MSSDRGSLQFNDIGLALISFKDILLKYIDLMGRVEEILVRIIK